jgi:fumarate hydratase class I
MENNYFKMFPLGDDKTEYRKLEGDFVKTETFLGQNILVIKPEALELLAKEAFIDMNHYLRTSHLEQLKKILDDNESSSNDKFVALELLKNANVAAGGVLPMCQDTGTVIVMGKKGKNVFVDSDKPDDVPLSEGAKAAYKEKNLRYSQLAPITMYKEKNTGNNLPGQIEIFQDGKQDCYEFLFIAKGGGSANKNFFYQGTPSFLTKENLTGFIAEKLKDLGTSACPPYHLGVVIGGTSGEFNLKTLKLATCRYLDELPTQGSESGHAFRDIEMERDILELTRKMGVGAQFGGKYFCHDVRVIRLPRHGASLPIGLGVSCSADRQVKAKITKDGLFIEKLETHPARFLPEVTENDLSNHVVNVDLNQPMKDILEILTQYPIKTRLSLTGTLIVARDLAHSKLRERLTNGVELPDYMKNHPVYYAGPAKTPEGYASGSFGPTTAGRMDSYVDEFQAHGGSMIMLAKGNRSAKVREACEKHGGFYLGSIGGPAAILAQDCIKKVEVVEFEELGMEAVWKIEVENFPAFIVIDDKGNDFFKELKLS